MTFPRTPSAPAWLSASPTVAHLAFPLMFVALYGSGFVGAKFGLPYAPPMTFLVLRFAIAAAAVALIARAVGAPWPNSWREAGHMMVAGSLTVGTFSAGVFVAINLGLSPALSALIIALQPILVAIGARSMLGERLRPAQWAGLALGLIGVAFVVSQELSFTAVHMTGLAFAVLGLVGLSLGNLYQKRFCAEMNIFAGGAIQSAASLLICLPFALMFESMQVEWTPEFAGALAYMAGGVSIGALSLLYVMIRRGEVSRVASIFYFVPVSAAVVSFILFGDKIGGATAVGIVVTAVGVTLVNRQPKGVSQ